MSILEEEWKDIPDYEGLYQVSNFGRVRSCDRVIFFPNGGSRYMKGSIMKLHVRGLYLRVGLVFGGKQCKFSVHKLVADAFVDGYFEGAQVNHIDGDKFNNNASNLEFCTASQNVFHAYDTGLSPFGSDRWNAKLSEADVLDIRRMIDSGHTQVSVAQMFSVSRRAVRAIIGGKTWTRVS